MTAYVYILTKRKHGALYTGVTRDVPQRIMQHRAGNGSEHCAQYGIKRLVYLEEAPAMLEALAREKQIKHWNRAWRVALIESINPDWRDLFYDLNR